MPGSMSTLATDFPDFSSIQQRPAQSQSANAALQQLNVSMQRAGFQVTGGGGVVAPQFDWGSLFGSVGSAVGGIFGGSSGAQTGGQIGGIIGSIGHGFGLFSADATDLDMQLFDGWMQGQVSDLINKLYGYVNQYSQLVDCVPLVTETVNLFADKKYIKALSKGYEAFNCIRSKL